ncbi:HIG1 domain-containing protein [Limibacillus halophilus]|jgi:hypothetical protein
MQTFIFVLVGIALFVTLGVLMAGVVVMARGGAVNDKWGNKLMRARVISQGVTLGLLVLALLLGK